MKTPKTYLLLLLLAVSAQLLHAQCTTITLRPDSAGIDAVIIETDVASNYGNHEEMVSARWTFGGTPGEMRSLLKFDLSAIPQGATITSAKLSLYADLTGTNSYPGQPTYGSNNASYLKLITSAWGESTVTWSNQPSTSATDQVLLPQSSSTAQDYPNLDIAAFVQQWVSNPAQNYGMLLDMITNNHYNAMVFGSSDNIDSTIRPKLEICFIPPQTGCVTLRPSSADGIDAVIIETDVASNYGNHEEMVSARWTFGGTPGEMRSLLKFDLSTIPQGATITSAKLSLYADTTATNSYPGQPTYGNNNASYLKLITSAWGESTVTWSNQPSTSATDQVLLPQSSSTAQDYPNLDIAAFVQQWVNNPAQNYGMLLDMITNNHYNAMVFGSSDNVDSTIRPKLEICYTPPQTVCATLRPDSAGIDAVIIDTDVASNYGNHEEMVSARWTFGGTPGEMRSLLKFDLSSIPQGATVTSAKLSLYADTTATNSYPGQPTYGNNNASYLKLITSAWGESTVTWSNQPSTSATDQVLLAQSSNTAQDYLDLDIAAFVQQWVANPAQNYGMLFDMITNNHYNAMVFGSSDNPDSIIRPKLEVCYTLGNGCTVNAAYTSTTSSDTAILTNTSSPLGAIASYEVIAKYSSTGAVYSHTSGAFSTINRVKLPQDSIMNVCLVAHDTSGACIDTFCSTIGIWQPCAVVSGFTFTQTGSAVLLYNTSTGNYPPLTYQWLMPGGWPSSSTATDTAVYYPQTGVHQICLIATNAIGCKDTFCTNITNVPTDTLCGMVFTDANSNGLFDAGEHVRPNSTVDIDGTIFYTDNTGFYKAPVSSGVHVLTLIAPPGWVQTAPDTPLTYTITTQTGDYICGLDFGMNDDTLILSGVVYDDNNGNGLYDAGDAPRVNQVVYISGINGNYTEITNPLGQYAVMVYSGTYNVTYNVPTGYSQTQPINPNTYTVTLYNVSMSGLNFGVQSNSVTISGKLFVDANNNGTYDNGEAPVSNQPVTIGTSIVFSNINGNWSIVKPAGTYTVSYGPVGNYSGYTLSTPASIIVSAANGGNTYGNNNFGLYIAPGVGDVCITLGQVTNVTPALGLARYVIALQNYGSTPMAGTLEMNHDPLLSFHSSNVTPASISAPNYVVTWQVTVPVGQTVYIRPNFSVSSSAQVGNNVFNQVFYNPAQGFTDINMACNDDTLHQQVLLAYDPNDKYVSPIGFGSSHAIRNVGETLDYTIMFQNTGNAPAANVILRDTVEQDLDISSFEMRNASHDCHVQIEDRIITWIFSNIMLPDSNTDVDSSIGYVSFSMNANTNLANGTLVTNRAGIYFDYNDVVGTGTAFNTIEKVTGITELGDGVEMKVQPNPFTAYTTITINGGNDKLPYTVKVYDITGKVVTENNNLGNHIRIERNGMAQGIYTYEVKQNNTLIGKGKLIAE